MKVGFLNVFVLAGIPASAAVAAALTKLLSRYSFYEAVNHPFFALILFLGGYEFYAGWYLYKYAGADGGGAQMSVVEPVVVISTVLLGVLIAVGVWKETLSVTRAVMLSAIILQLVIFLYGKIPWVQ